MEEIMSNFISAIKLFIARWVERNPRVVHYESAEPSLESPIDGIEQSAGVPSASIERRDIVIRQTVRATPPGKTETVESVISILIGPGCNLSEQDLSGAQLEGIDLRGANLRGARLSGANFKGANLSGADFTNAHLVFTQLRDAIVTGTNFTNVNLTGANMVGVDLSTATMSMAKMLNTTTTGDVDFYTYLKGFNPDWEPKKN